MTRPPFKETADADRLKIIRAEVAADKKKLKGPADEIMEVIWRYCAIGCKSDYLILHTVILSGLVAAYAKGRGAASQHAVKIMEEVKK